MPSYDYDLGVIGAGAAGLTAAAGAARLGAKVLLIERGPALGGDCLHFGCVPSKTLLATARLRHAMTAPQAYGLPPSSLPPVDFAQVRERIASVIAHIQKHDSPERFQRLGADVAFGQAAFTDDHAVSLEGKRISAARWINPGGQGSRRRFRPRRAPLSWNPEPPSPQRDRTSLRPRRASRAARPRPKPSRPRTVRTGRTPADRMPSRPWLMRREPVRQTKQPGKPRVIDPCGG